MYLISLHWASFCFLQRVALRLLHDNNDCFGFYCSCIHCDEVDFKTLPNQLLIIFPTAYFLRFSSIRPPFKQKDKSYDVFWILMKFSLYLREAFKKEVTFVKLGGGQQGAKCYTLKKMLKIHFRPNGAFFVKKIFLVYGGGQPLIFCPLDKNFVKISTQMFWSLGPFFFYLTPN